MNVKTVLAAVLACGALVSLGGCASMSKKGDPSAMVPQTYSDRVDAAYVQQVDFEAQAQGVKVVWVNPPNKDHHN